MSTKSVVIISLIFCVIAMLCICSAAKYRRRVESLLSHSSRAKSSKMKYLQRVFYGYKIWNEDYPFVIQVMYSMADGTQSLCTGSIITARCILTAAHCVIDRNLYNFEIIIAREKHTVFHYIIPKSKFIPKRYNQTTSKHDVALLVLSQPINSDIAKRVAVSVRDYEVEKIRFYGWGMLAPDEPQGHRLRYFVAETWPWRSCKESVPFLTRHVICTKWMSTRVAYGDSGGPVLDWETGLQIGVVSGVVNYKNPEFWKRDGISIVTRIGARPISNWLTRTVENNCN